MLNEEFKSCPFCDSKLKITSDEDGVFIWHETNECSLSGIGIPIQTWNIRPIEDALTAECAALKSQLAQAREAIKKVNEYVGEIHESCHESVGDEYVAHCHAIAEIALDELDEALRKLPEVG